MDEPTLLNVDARGRVPLGRLTQEGQRYWLATPLPDGAILLEVPVVMTEAQYAEHVKGGQA